MVAKIPWFSIGRFALIVLCLAIVLALVVVILPIYLDITAFKGPVEEILTAFAEAPVTVDNIRLHPSLWPTLVISGVEVAGSGWEESPPFSRIDRVEIRLALLPLLERQLRLKRLFVSGAIFHAHRPEGRTGNWPIWTTMPYEITELADIELANVTIELEDHQTVQATAIIDHLTCDIAKNRPLDLEFYGSLEGLPLSLSAGGPTLATPLSQASDFPLSLHLELADLRLDLDGSASREPGGTKYQFSFDLESAGLIFFRELRETDLPQIGGFQLSGQLSNRTSSLEITGLEGSVGSMSVHGGLALDQTGDRPHLSGRLSMGQLEVEPWLAYWNEKESDTGAPLPFSHLAALDADLKLTLQDLTGFEISMEDLSLEVELENGVLSVPTNLRAAGVPLSAHLKVRGDVEVPEVSTRVRAHDLTLRQLDRIIDIPDELDGELGNLELDIRSSGNSFDELSTNLMFEAAAKETALTLMDETGEAPIEIFLSQVQAKHMPGQPLIVTARGHLLEDPFSLDLQTSSLANLIEDRTWPLDAKMQGAGADIDLAGTVTFLAEGVDLDLDFLVAGDRLGDLDNWLGFPPDANLPYSLTGHLATEGAARALRLDDLSVGSTRLTGDFTWNLDEESEPYSFHLHAFTLALQELRDLSNSVIELDTEEDVIGIDLPILPSKVYFHDADLELTVDQLLRDTVDLTDVAASFRFREGRLERSPFSFAYDTQVFDGEIDLDLRQDIPRFALELHGDGEYLGELLDREQIVSNFLVKAKKLDLRIEATGASIRKIAQTADVTGQLVDVRWQIHLPESDETVEVRLESLDLSGPKGAPILLQATGFLDQEPLDLRLELRFPVQPEKGLQQSVPFHLAVGIAATSLELAGEATLPITDREMEIQIVLEGASLASLSSLLDRELPALGPYRVEGRLALSEAGYSLGGLDVALGESDLHGEISYQLVDRRPTFTADLKGERIRTQDILLLGEEEDTGDGEDPEAEEAQKRSEKPNLTLGALQGFDASIDLQIQELATVGGSLESLVIDADLDRGSLDLFVKQPQPGNLDAELSAKVRPSGQGVEVQVQARWDRQPYGFLADMISPGSAGGSWSVNLDLDSRGSTFDDLVASLAGHLDFTDYPADFDATIIDLWGGGLLNSLLPVFNLGEESRVNCTVGRFVVDQGLMSAEALILDNTRSRVRGKGTIDLPGNEIKLRLKPRPKQRSLINLATPVTIRGSLADPSVQVSKGGLAVTFFRFSLWIYTVWRDVIRTPLPAEGHDICVDPPVRP